MNWTEAQLTDHLKRRGIAHNSMSSETDPPSPPPIASADVVINLPMPPTSNNMFFNSAKGKGRTKTPEYQDWIKEAGWRLLEQRPACIHGRVSILIEVSDAESADTWDVANREKATVDLLVSHKIIKDDGKRYLREITLRWADVAGVRVTVRPHP